MGLLGLGRLAGGLSTTVRLGAQLYRFNSGGNGWFNAEEWESTYPEILDDATYKYGNPGQDVILNEYWIQAAEEFCQNYEDYSEGFDRDDFVNYINDDIGDEKYEAVSEITDEASWELEEAYSRAGGKTGNSRYRVFANNAAAEMKYALVFGATEQFRKRVARINSGKTDSLSRFFLMMERSPSFKTAYENSRGSQEAKTRFILNVRAGLYGKYPTTAEARSYAYKRAQAIKYKTIQKADAVAKARAAVY